MNDFLKSVSAFYKEYATYVNLSGGAIIFLFFFLLRNKLSKSFLSLFGKMIYKDEEKQNSFISALQKPLSVFFSLLGLFALLYLNVASSPILKGFKILTILVICWGIMNYLSSNISNAFKLKEENDMINVTAVKFISNIIRILVISLAVVMIISELGYNINGLITGLGVGGLAVSLAAQDAIKNLLSGFIIVFDKPFKVGDMISTGDIKGTILEVTMRSTKIRTIEDTVVTLPNSKLTDDAIVNISKMEKRLIDTNIGLTYSTPNKTITKCVEDIKNYLLSRDDIIPEPMRVEFSEFEDSSLIICIFCYTTVIDVNDYYSLLNEINLKIKTIVEDNSAEFAFPTQTLHIEK